MSRNLRFIKGGAAAASSLILGNTCCGRSDAIAVDASKSANVYSVQGTLVKANASNLNGLAKGIYIVNGKKYVAK